MSDDERSRRATEEIKEALRDGAHGSIRVVYVFGQGLCAQVYRKTRKIGPVIIPDREGGQTLADVLRMLGEWAEEAP